MPGLRSLAQTADNMSTAHGGHQNLPSPLKKTDSKENSTTRKWLRLQCKKKATLKNDKSKEEHGDEEGVDRAMASHPVKDRLVAPKWAGQDCTGECWEVDSGISSGSSLPPSGRSSPCSCMNPSRLVALDCEMVGTGLGGRCSELARCSLVTYRGDVLYDQYIRPLRPVVDYRTRWSGICKRHLVNAVPFSTARQQIIQLLKGKVIVGHALHNDFRALGFIPPRHMIRDTCRSIDLKRLAGLSAKEGVSLKRLSKVLLNRNIQSSRRGHSSVEDASAAMDLYKLVETQWEEAVETAAVDQDASPLPDPVFSPSHYMQDQYWPDEIQNSVKKDGA